jgi:ribA/ribD-fused uncharacterized protein
MFRAFVQNVKTYTSNTFFGTCLDGQAVYSLLLGKQTHIFTNGRDVGGEYLKEYEDRDTWTEEFGMPVKVFLESFDRPAIEYLVPFEKVTSILEEYGWALVETKLFSELYANQNGITLTQEQQVFSFLNRTFVFKRSSTKSTKENDQEHPEETVDGPKPSEVAETPKPEEDTEKKPTKRKLRKSVEVDGPPPVLFHGADESKGDYRNFSNMSEHRIDIDGSTYPTVEHYFQAMKAKEFKDDEIYEKLLKAKSAKAAKALGKKVKGFEKEVWDAKKDGIMQVGIRTKFVQHPELRKQLQETGDRIIGEADARNTYWGIGTSMTSEKAKHPTKWRGQNRIGKILMDLRTEFNDQGHD